jgi:hypothetical protein
MYATLAGLAAALLYTIASIILGRQLLRHEKLAQPRHSGSWRPGTAVTPALGACSDLSAGRP